MDEKPTDCKYSRWEGESIKSLKCILTNTLCDPRICPKVQEKETVEKVLESKVEVESRQKTSLMVFLKDFIV